MSARTFAALRWRIIRHGPHDERGFGLVTGLVAAAGVVTVAVLAARAAVHPSWLTVAVSVFGLTWIVGPALLPTSAPVVDPRWFRTLPHSPHRIARDLAPSEAIAVGPVISAVALSGMVVLAAPHGTVAALVAVVAAGAQLFVLLWIGRWVSAALTRLLRSAAGLWLAAVQMSVLLAVSFAGWVPIAAWVLPGLGHGTADVVTPSVPGAVPDVVQTVLFALPTGWGMAAVDAVTSSGSPLSVAGLLAALVLTGLLARRGWIALTARTVAQPPARMRSGIRARRRAAAARAHPRRGGPVRAVVDREIATWFRDPHRLLGLGHAWVTPVLMIGLVAPTSWSWALPFIGVVAAALAGMVAVNTYALDGTALWQLLSTPRAVRADVHGRAVAWLVLFGLPIVGGTVVLCVLSGSPLWPVALGMTVAATGAAASGSGLTGVLMPAIGADARNRVSTADAGGNAAGGQWAIFTAVAAVAALPVVLVAATGHGGTGAAHLVLGVFVGAAACAGIPRLTRARLDRTGPALLAAMASRDLSRLRQAR